MPEDKLRINVFEEIGGEAAVSVDDGEVLNQRIQKALGQDVSVVLNFKNISLITTAFLNAAIGQLYSRFKGDELNRLLSFENVAPEDTRLFKKVVERAKEYFAHKKEIDDDLRRSLGNG